MGTMSTLTPGSDGGTRAVFDWSKALEKDSTLQRIGVCVDRIMAKFPGQVVQASKAVAPSTSRYKPAPAAAAAAMKSERGTETSTTSAATDSYSPGLGRQFINPKDYKSESSSEVDMREVNPMDELSDFESEPSLQQHQQKRPAPPPAVQPAPAPAVARSESPATEVTEQAESVDEDVDMGVEPDESMHEDSEEEDKGEPTACEVCHSSEDASNTLLCDGCDAEYHIYCLNPPLSKIPEGEWFCPNCVKARPVESTSTFAASATSARNEHVKTEQALQARAANGGWSTSQGPPSSASGSSTARSATEAPLFGSASGTGVSGPTSANGGDAPSTATSISIMQALAHDLAKSNSLLVHACNCDNARCTSTEFQELCPHMKRFLRSVCWASHSEKWRSYRLAQVTAELFAFHAMNCNLAHCNVPLCDKIREEEIV